MKKFIRFMAITFAAFLCFCSLAACADDPAAGKTKIAFWSPPFAEVETRNWLTKYTDLYNATNEDNVYIDLQLIPEDAWEQTLKAAQSNGTAPQVTFKNYADVPLKATDGMYLPLDDYMSESVWDDLMDNVQDMVTLGNGKRYIYPAFVEPYSILFYSKSAFKAAGIDPNSPPKSWNEFYEYAKKLNKSGQYGVAMPNSSQLGWVMWGFQAMSGSYLLNDNWDSAVVNNDFHKELFELFKKTYDEGLTPKVALSSYNEITPLAQGKVAMQLCGSWAMGQLKNTYPDKVSDIGYAACPTQTGVTENVTTAALGGWGFTIDGNAQNPVDAGKFIEWLLAGDTSYMVEYFKSLGYSKFAPRKSVNEVLNTSEDSKNDSFRKYVSDNIMPYAKAEPCYIWDISKQYADSIEKVTLLNKSINSELAALQTYLNNLISGQGLAGTNPRIKAAKN